ncbi:hypothetical protein [Phenylobacterium sp.]|jgi:hypothetical protein|uniref:hypothetical protein n=1 Tax=Phenylobacterium sp. TaxID=1871053 RepID=UPI002F42AD0E
MQAVRQAIGILAGCAAILSSHTAAAEPASGTTRFILDGNRVYAELDFLRPDGSVHRALAFVDMGAPDMTVNEALHEDLHLGADQPLAFKVGGLTVRVPASSVQQTHGRPQGLAGESVEATLPASVLQTYQVVIDYRARRLTLARPGVLKPVGVATPFRINEATGIISVDAIIDGSRYALTIDNGSAWTWLRQDAVRDWESRHPTWAHGVGAVGASNMMMVGDLEATGLLARVPTMAVGAVSLTSVDVLGPGPTTAFPFELFDWYSRKNARPVLGWLGGNVLKRYRLTIDYPHRELYWLAESPPDRHELDQVGVTLRRRGADYLIAAVARRNDCLSVPAARVGDKLLAVDGMALKDASWGAIFTALHGRPGERRTLTVERDGQVMRIAAAVTAF